MRDSRSSDGIVICVRGREIARMDWNEWERGLVPFSD